MGPRGVFYPLHAQLASSWVKRVDGNKDACSCPRGVSQWGRPAPDPQLGASTDLGQRKPGLNLGLPPRPGESGWGGAPGTAFPHPSALRARRTGPMQGPGTRAPPVCPSATFSEGALRSCPAPAAAGSLMPSPVRRRNFTSVPGAAGHTTTESRQTSWPGGGVFPHPPHQRGP